MRRNSFRLRPAIVVSLSLCLFLPMAHSQMASPTSAATPSTGTTAAAPVIASGSVPDEATKAAVLTRLRELYGDDRVVDRIEVDAVVAPPNWREHVLNLLGPNLQQVSAGQLDINGNAVRIKGTVGNEAQRQQVASGLSTALNSTWSVNNALRTGGVTRQNVLDQALADRIIEFQSGSATLTPGGQAILNEMAAALLKIGEQKVQVIGHTDSVGGRDSNVGLSMARAASVKHYLEQAGVSGDHLSVLGLGPDEPVADNATAEGRARNRRIEFRVL